MVLVVEMHNIHRDPLIEEDHMAGKLLHSSRIFSY
jgi:hypothetical protein